MNMCRHKWNVLCVYRLKEIGKQQDGECVIPIECLYLGHYHQGGSEPGLEWLTFIYLYTTSLRSNQKYKLHHCYGYLCKNSSTWMCLRYDKTVYIVITDVLQDNLSCNQSTIVRKSSRTSTFVVIFTWMDQLPPKVCYEPLKIFDCNLSVLHAIILQYLINWRRITYERFSKTIQL